MSDLKFGVDKPTAEEQEAIDDFISGVGPALSIKVNERFVVGGRSRAKDRRRLLLPALHELQSTWLISPGGLNYICKVLGVPCRSIWRGNFLPPLLTSNSCRK